ncbi:thioredoxin [Pelodictyon luteolum]|uniref:Thioredoxin n=1 Tax=Chlorobium luteolum (strain DSM 273 / BCRC 81028 / 2530) TaxID=319225 RepID=Q3B3J0_CHLL3|nr:thioredoxin [Pelodictyon luteolum]ABB24091.1 Thioredoxin [Pelodictyon luteolum DSM 273]
MAEPVSFDFQRDVIDRSYDLPVLVDFWAEWCAPCRMLAPVLEKLAERHIGGWVLVKVNTEEYPDIASRYQIRGIPAVMLFSGGEVRDSFTGALAEHQIEEWLQKAVPGPYAKEVLLAEEFIREGKLSMALSVLEGVIESEPGNLKALSLLLKLKLFSAPGYVLALSPKLDAEVEYMELAGTLKTLSRLLDASLSAFPEDDLRADYLAAIECLRREDFDGALKGFIDVLRRNRGYDDDGSRTACIAIFRFLGEEHEVSIRHRRSFDRAF